ITTETGIILVRAILDRMRRNRAVSFDFFQRYIDPTRDPWSQLVEDPYYVTIPERERGPIFFMLDRNEEARHAISGFSFQALARDSRGGLSAVARMLKKSGLTDDQATSWIREAIAVLVENEILETPEFLPHKIRSKIGANAKPLQIAARVIRLHKA